METKDYLKILKEEIHSTVFATVDENGLPQARVIDIMLVDDNSLYFITAKGKEFYHQFIRYIGDINCNFSYKNYLHITSFI